MEQRDLGTTTLRVPAVGMGTWRTFDVRGKPEQSERKDLVTDALALGVRLFDSSPMYGEAERVLGAGLTGRRDRAFVATKVWNSDAGEGQRQIDRALHYFDGRVDLYQVHNLVASEAHLETLFAMKAEGRIRYVGISTSEGRRHDAFEAIMRSRPIDFVQLTYNPIDREAESRLLPLAAERGISVIVNRPFRQGELTRRLEGEALPGSAAELGAVSWAQLILKFILAHPAVTAVIPATTRVDHVRENVAAAAGPFPDSAMREKMAAHLQAL